ncbi:hypothetical protein [Sporosarcina sp. OR05]|uniref:hypothetical protein n=1 Tax=Sporosarcina sp. OR05 TaxID=2969819 RepID=UPI00352AA402
MILEDYLNSMDAFDRYKGHQLREFISDLTVDHKVEINDVNSMFYARGFYAEELTDKLYYFGKVNIKVVELIKDDGGKLECITIANIKTSSIIEVELTLGRDREVGIQIKFKDGTDLIFHNKEDSDGKNNISAGNQIKSIYSLLTE